MHEWTDGVHMAVDILIACVIVVAMIVCGQITKSIRRAVDEEKAVAADVREYRVARMYENEDCYAQDIVSLVLEYQGTPAVNVTTKSGATVSWSSGIYHTQLTAASISAALNQSSVYRCTLSYDANGSLSAYNFREV